MVAVERATPLLVPGLVARVRAHQERGDRVFLVTASVDEFAASFALRMGMDGGVGSTFDRAIPAGPTLPNYGAAKAVAIDRLAAAHRVDLSSSAAYSDSISDLPMLERVGQPVAVNPDRALRRVAAERRWETIEHPGLRCHLTNARAFRSRRLSTAAAA